MDVVSATIITKMFSSKYLQILLAIIIGLFLIGAISYFNSWLTLVGLAMVVTGFFAGIVTDFREKEVMLGFIIMGILLMWLNTQFNLFMII